MKHRPAPHEPAAERWVVDALEDSPTGQVARVELPDGRTRDIELKHLPAGVREGDILHVQDGPDGFSAQLQPQETAQAKAEAQARLTALNDAGAEALAQSGQEITL